MAVIDPSVSFSNSFNAAQNVTDTFRKNMAFKALEKTYGPIVGDMKLASDVQAYEHNALLNPLKVEEQQLSNASATSANAFNEKLRPMLLQSQEQSNETAAFNQDQAETEADRTARLQKAQEIHTSLSGVLGNVETALDGVQDPNERLAIFDQQVREIAPMIGAEPDALLHSLAQQRAAIAAQGTAAIGPMRKQLDDTLYAGLSAEDRQKLETGKLDQQLKTAQIITEGAQAEKYTADAEKARVEADEKIAEKGKEAKAAARALDDFEAKQQIVQSYIADAIKYAKEHPLATGLAASTPGMNQLPEVVNLAAKLKTIGANIGFAELSRIKASGATLGPVSNYENELLQSVQGAIVQGQDQNEFVLSLEGLGEALEGSAQRLRDAYMDDFGDIDLTAVEEDTPDGEVILYDEWLKAP